MALVLAIDSTSDADAGALDMADGFVFADDDAATLGAVFEAVTRGEGSAHRVRDFSDGTARTINALSAEAGRIAEALARLAERERRDDVVTPIDAALVRRLLRSRRDRDRFFPADIFADPAWDMLLDLTAARLESKVVPVSSLCIAAAVPTTTALRWIRSLTEAGLFERRTDPSDARRTHISLSEQAAAGMIDYLRLFSSAWAPR